MIARRIKLLPVDGRATDTANGSRKLKGLFRIRVRVKVDVRFPFQ